MVSVSSTLALLVLLPCLTTWSSSSSSVMVVLAANESSTALNVYGEPLKQCSQPGMALTGYTRTGYCVDEDDDHGSHHICINLASISQSGKNFCTVTGQPDWCSSSMTCQANDSVGVGEGGIGVGGGKLCPVSNWCVCQWAFEGYITKAGGCNAIQDIQCEAVNIVALKAYEADVKEHGMALACLKQKCKLQDKEEGSVKTTTTSVEF